MYFESLFILIVFLDCMCCSFLSLPVIFGKTFIENRRIVGYINETQSCSIQHCANLCVYFDSQCLSFGYEVKTRQCRLYRDRIINNQPSNTVEHGWVYYWALAGNCTESYNYNDTFNICIKTYSDAANSDVANKICIKDGGHLLIANTLEIRQFVYDNAGPGIYLLGATKLDDVWTWLNGLNVTGWRPGEPNDSGGIEDCLQMVARQNGQILLNDAPCSTKYKYVCQIPLVP